MFPPFLKAALDAKALDFGLAPDVLVTKLLIEALDLDPWTELLKDKDFQFFYIEAHSTELSKAGTAAAERATADISGASSQYRKVGQAAYDKAQKELAAQIWEDFSDFERLEWLERMATWHGPCGYKDITVKQLIQSLSAPDGLGGVAATFDVSMSVAYRRLSPLIKKWKRVFPKTPDPSKE